MTSSNEASLRLFLDRLTSRSVLTSQEQEAILGLPAKPWVVSTNNDFVRLGEQVDHASLIVSGLVGRFEQTAKGERQITNLYIEGDMPDVHSVVQPTAPSALQALSSSTVLRVPHSALRQAAADYPGIAEALWRDCVVDLMIHAQWVANVGCRDAKTRIAHLLCEMACRSRAPVTDGKVIFHLPMTQTHIADATGLTPVHVNRCLKGLEGAGVVLRSKTVRIADWDALTRLADFDRGYLQEGTGASETRRMAAMS
jgi:CRP-like cAMP-binding protein